MLAILHARKMRQMGRSLPAITLVLCLVGAIFNCPASAAQNPRGALRGVVVDQTGARVPAARISVRALGFSADRQVSGDGNGEFRVDDLPPGAYRVSVVAQGFAEAGSDVSVLVSGVRDITVTLKPG